MRPIEQHGQAGLVGAAPQPADGGGFPAGLLSWGSGSAAALLDATGFRWLEPGSDEPMFEKLASTLGKPDYIQNTLEDLSPSLLFHKFLDDSARFVCTELMAAETERSPEDRIFLVGIDPTAPLSDSTATNSALAGALLRFHGRHVAPTDSALDVWRWLLENTVSSEEEPLLPWLNVCAGLITHPDFYAY